MKLTTDATDLITHLFVICDFNYFFNGIYLYVHILLYIYIILVCLLDFLWVFQIFTVTFSAKKLGSSTGRFANATLMRLAEFLSVGYKKGVRPVKDWNTPTNVEIDLMVYSILNVVSYAVYKAITIFCVLYIYILYSI